METQARIKEWAADMGYTGKFSKSLQWMSGPSTCLVWEQLVSRVQPKGEIEKIHNNVLLYRTQCRLDKRELRYPIETLEMYKKKTKLEEETKSLGERISASNKRINHSSTQNRIKYLKIDNLNEKIKEKRRQVFLLNSKSAVLKTDLVQSREKLTFCSTPVETIQADSEILDTLNKCAEKVERLINEQNLDVCKLSKPRELEVSAEMLVSESSENTRAALGKEIHCFEDECLFSDVDELLHDNNNFLLWKAFIKSIISFSFDLKKLVISERSYNSHSVHENPSKTLSLLHSKFIEIELRAIRHERNVKKLKLKLQTQQNCIFRALKKMEPKPISDLKKLILLEQKEVGLRALHDCIYVQIKMLLPNSSTALIDARKKSFDIQQQMVEKQRVISYKLNLYKRIYLSMISMNEETLTFVRKLNQFTSTNWKVSPTDNVIAKEIDVFRQFCVGCNRQTTIKNVEVYAKDRLTDDLVGCEDLDAGTYYMLATIIESSFSPTETILLDAIRSKIRLDVLKLLQDTPQKPITYKKYDFDELRKEESYLKYCIDELNVLMRPSNTSQILSSASKMSENVRLWLEMPMTDFVGRKRLFDGHGCEYYQNLYDASYDKLMKF